MVSKEDGDVEQEESSTLNPQIFSLESNFILSFFSQHMVFYSNKNMLIFSVLKIIKEAQQQHGLRHGDYQRYRGYCSRRLKRLRKVLKIPQGDRRHFKRRDVTPAMITSEKFLQIPLMQAERNWSYAMQLRQESNTEPRKKFHLISRLRKAGSCSLGLQELIDVSLTVTLA